VLEVGGGIPYQPNPVATPIVHISDAYSYSVLVRHFYKIFK